MLTTDQYVIATAEAENFWAHEHISDPEFTEESYHVTDDLKDSEFDPELDAVDDDDADDSYHNATIDLLIQQSGAGSTVLPAGMTADVPWQENEKQGQGHKLAQNYVS